jgi:putative ATPase
MKTAVSGQAGKTDGGAGLFDAPGQAAGSIDKDAPLAERMRPRTLDEVEGQEHIVGKGRLLRRAIQADRLSSVIFYGPPGTGKTSLARVVANHTKAAFESLNAVLCGIKDIRDAIDRSKNRKNIYEQRTILFVDEVHRWNKAQQDALLPWVENGTVILIGATTENPFFEVNRALVSRSRIFQLKPLTSANIRAIAQRALQDKERGYGKWKVIFETDAHGRNALDHLVNVAGGDARSLLNALELAVETTPAAWPPPEGTEIFISMEAAQESIQRRALLYDRDGDYHFDTISAFIKSMRGSDPDAALYWLAKMVRAGEDPGFIFRRMVILASEDIGLADPHAVEVVIACWNSFDRIGFPEGNYPLAEACLYLSTAPKSNSAMAYFDALKEVEAEDAEVPNHLRDASRDSEGFGHGEGYIYPHDYREHWVAQQYLPTILRGKTFYTPGSIGYEAGVREQVLRKRELQAAVVLGEGGCDAGEGEVLSWSASGRGREGWYKRLENGRSKQLLEARDLIFNKTRPNRQDRVLVCNANDGLLLWEALRRCPEGLSAGLVDRDEARAALLQFASAALGVEEMPLIGVLTSRTLLPTRAQAEEWFDTSGFEHIVGREILRRCAEPENVLKDFAGRAFELLEPGADLVLLASPPSLGQRLAELLGRDLSTNDTNSTNNKALIAELAQAEEAFFASGGAAGAAPSGAGWNAGTLEQAFKGAGFTVQIETQNEEEMRLIRDRDVEAWFNAGVSAWGKFIRERVGDRHFEAVHAIMKELVKKGPVRWKRQSLLVFAVK